MKILSVMNTVVLIFGFIGVVFWASDRYEETLSEISQLSENLEEAQFKLTEFAKLRDEFIAQEERLTALRSEIPIISKQVAGEAVAETNIKLQELQNQFNKIKTDIANVEVLPDGMIEVESKIVYDLVPGTTFVVNVGKGGSRYGASLVVAGQKVTNLSVGQSAKVGPNKECIIEFISARDGDDNDRYAILRKTCS